MSAAFRSIAPFVRTARQGLVSGRASPLQAAFRKQSVTGMLNICRTYAAVFERTKPHVNIGTDLPDCERLASILTVRHRNHWPRRSRKGTTYKDEQMTSGNSLS